MDLFAFISNSRSPAQKLEDAVRNNAIEELDKILKDGLDPNIPLHKQGGNTAIHIAAVYGHFLCIEHLLAAGASGDTPNDIRVTPLFNAARSKHPRAIQSLLKNTKSAFDFDHIWADKRWIDLIVQENMDDVVLSNLLIGTPDICQVRQNLRNNLIHLCSRNRHFKSFKVFMITGNFQYDINVKSQIGLLQQTFNSQEVPEDIQMFLDWSTEFINQKKPLSLEHFCCLAVRRSFHGNCNVYYGTNRLELPTVLRNNILYPLSVCDKESA